MIQNQTLYRKVYNRILQDANGGKFPVGTAMPTLKQLMKNYDVGQSTLRRALADLKNDKYIKTRQGGGIYLTAKACKGKAGHALTGKELIHTDLHTNSGFLASYPAKTKLKIAFIDGCRNHQVIWNKIIDNFKALNPTIEIEPSFEVDCSNLDNIEFDMFQVAVPAIQNSEIKKKLYPIHREFIKIEDYPEYTFHNITTKDNSVYGVPTLATYPVLLVNMKILEQAGVELDENTMDWKKFKEIALSLSRARESKCGLDDYFVAGYVHGSFLYLCAIYPYIRKYLKTDELKLDVPEVRDFISEMAEIGSKNKIVMQDSTYRSIGGIKKLFVDEKIAMIAAVSMDIDILYPDGLPKHIKVMPSSIGKSGTAFWNASYMGINRKSLMLGECLNFMKFLGSGEAMKIVAEHGELPVIQSGIKDTISYRRETVNCSLPLNCLSEQQVDFILNSFNPIVNYARDGLLSPDATYRILQEKCHDFYNRT
jgi:DNA-binding transcriptional regulator YhcF (GntR family)